MLPYIIGKRQTAESGLNDDHVGQKFHQEPLGNQDAEPVCRACQVVHIEGEKVGADSGVPRVKEALPVPELVVKLHQKGKVLMVHINVEKGALSKRVDLLDHKDDKHDQCRDEERKQIQRIVFYIRFSELD